MRPLAFVDLETTGATATTNRITEIGIVEVDADGTRRGAPNVLSVSQSLTGATSGCGSRPKSVSPRHPPTSQ